jgi:hypothetical protein
VVATFLAACKPPEEQKTYNYQLADDYFSYDSGKLLVISNDFVSRDRYLAGDGISGGKSRVKFSDSFVSNYLEDYCDRGSQIVIVEKEGKVFVKPQRSVYDEYYEFSSSYGNFTLEVKRYSDGIYYLESSIPKVDWKQVVSVDNSNKRTDLFTTVDTSGKYDYDTSSGLKQDNFPLGVPEIYTKSVTVSSTDYTDVFFYFPSLSKSSIADIADTTAQFAIDNTLSFEYSSLNIVKRVLFEVSKYLVIGVRVEGSTVTMNDILTSMNMAQSVVEPYYLGLLVH